MQLLAELVQERQPAAQASQVAVTVFAKYPEGHAFAQIVVPKTRKYEEPTTQPPQVYSVGFVQLVQAALQVTQMLRDVSG